MSFAAFARPESNETTKKLTSMVTDSEAIELAIQAGKSHCQGRRDAPLRDLVAAIEDDAGQEVIADGWYVSGERVNLRAGPETGIAESPPQCLVIATVGTKSRPLTARFPA